MITRRLFAAIALGSTVLAAAPAALAAAEAGTRDEAKALCEAAVAHIKKVGLEQASKDFTADRAKWMPKDLYPFVMQFDGVMKFHLSDKLINRQMADVKDASGREFGKEMIATAKTKGTGWIDYEWMHPVTKKVEDKTSYVMRVPGAELFVGVGVYR